MNPMYMDLTSVNCLIRDFVFLNQLLTLTRIDRATRENEEKDNALVAPPPEIFLYPNCVVLR